jgi:hypothetical protein
MKRMLENAMIVGAQAQYERERFGTDPLPEPGAPEGPLLHPMFAGILESFLAIPAMIRKATPDDMEQKP